MSLYWNARSIDDIVCAVFSKYRISCRSVLFQVVHLVILVDGFTSVISRTLHSQLIIVMFMFVTWT